MPVLVMPIPVRTIRPPGTNNDTRIHNYNDQNKKDKHSAHIGICFDSYGCKYR